MKKESGSNMLPFVLNFRIAIYLHLYVQLQWPHALDKHLFFYLQNFPNLQNEAKDVTTVSLTNVLTECFLTGFSEADIKNSSSDDMCPRLNIKTHC